MKTSKALLFVLIALFSLPVSAELVGKGIACFPECGDGAKALELAKEGEYMVLAMDEDPVNVAKAREAAAAAGLLGRSLYIEQGTPDKIPFADHYVDLLVLDHLNETDLTQALAREIDRVLTPIHGTALLGGPAGKEKIAKWIRVSGVECRVSEEMDSSGIGYPASGIALQWRKPPLQGSDWWMHKLHGPNNNQVSKDTAFSFPPILQYRAMPMYNSYNGTVLTSHGRQILLHDWTYHDTHRGSLCGRIQVRNSYNGQLLWEGMLPENIEANTPIFAATKDALFMASGSNGHILRRDLDNGDELAPVVLGGEDRRVKWLAVDGNTVYALLGGAAEVRRPYERMLQNDIFLMQDKNESLFGNELVARNMETGNNRWTHREPVNIDFRTVALHEGRLYFYAEGRRLACLDAVTGREQWSNTDEQWVKRFKRPQKVRNGNVRGMSTLKVDDGIVLLAAMEASEGLFFRAKDGEYMASYAPRRGGYTGQKTLILDGKVYKGNSEIDLQTGELNRDSNIAAPGSLAWCGIVTYAPGTGALGHSSLGYKTPCGVGAWVAGGILLYSPPICTCDNHMMGAGAYASGAGIFEQIKTAPSHPLRKGSAFAEIQNSKSEIRNAHDWPAYRGDSRHRGSSAAKVGAAVKTLWTAKPEHPFAYTTQYNELVTRYDERPTAPIVAGGRVYLAGSDGIVKTISLSGGQTLWTHAVDGPVLTAPAYADGRLFVPGADGWVYALDAGTGQLCWKRRVAPAERRIAVFQNLMNTWPVMSLAVEDDPSSGSEQATVYACAGMSIINGSTTLAMDAATGDIRWKCPIERTLAGSHLPPEGDAVGLGGVTAVIDDAVWMAGYGSIPLCLDKREGAVVPLPADLREFREKGNYFNFRGIYHMQGMHLIGLTDGCVIGGGRALFENHQLREGKHKRVEFKMYFTDHQGRLDLRQMPLRFIPVGRVAPAGDDELTALAALPATDSRGRPQGKDLRATRGVRVWETAKLIAEAQSMRERDPLQENQVTWKEVHRPLDDSKELWSKPELDVNALALAADALLVAHAGTAVEADSKEFSGLMAKREPLIEYGDWKITAFERRTGREMWSVGLPAEPLFDGLAVAADGTVVTALRDGTLVSIGN